jgi:hypothetical protein
MCGSEEIAGAAARPAVRELQREALRHETSSVRAAFFALKVSHVRRAMGRVELGA